MSPRFVAVVVVVVALCGSCASSRQTGLAQLSQVPAATWLPQAVGYEIFVPSFADSDGDGIGDLNGITARLDYLRDLGVDVLWLTPIYPAGSYHGYDITDYDSVNPAFGTLANFAHLIAEAHRRKMRVLLDLVINHTSSRHPWFLAAADSLGAPGARDQSRYLFRADDPGWQANGRHLFKPLVKPLVKPLATPLVKPLATPLVNPAAGSATRFYYSYFSGGLPDLNYRDPRVLPAMQAVVSRWLARGADGYRLDAARYVVESPDPATTPSGAAVPALSDTPETHRIWRALRHTALTGAAGAALLGEVWADLGTIAQYRGSGDELHGCFNFPLAGAILRAVRGEGPQPLRDLLIALSSGPVPASFYAPFLSNHDQKRSAAVLADDPARMRQAATLLLAMPGPPFLYYGEEIGMPQGTTPRPDDRAQRQPMPWDQVAAQQADAGSLLHLYKKLIALRRATPALHSDRLQVLSLSPPSSSSPSPSPLDDRLLAFARGGGNRGALVAVYNLSDAPVVGAHAALPADYGQGAQRDLLSGQPAAEVTQVNRGNYPLPVVPPRGALWLVGQ